MGHVASKNTHVAKQSNGHVATTCSNPNPCTGIPSSLPPLTVVLSGATVYCGLTANNSLREKGVGDPNGTYVVPFEAGAYIKVVDVSLDVNFYDPVVGTCTGTPLFVQHCGKMRINVSTTIGAGGNRFIANVEIRAENDFASGFGNVFFYPGESSTTICTYSGTMMPNENVGHSVHPDPAAAWSGGQITVSW